MPRNTRPTPAASPVAASTGVFVASPVAASIGATGVVVHPSLSEIDQSLARHVNDVAAEFTPPNTLKQYSSKIKEYRLFCEHVYPNYDFKYVIKATHLYRFLFYTSFRESKRRGGRNKNPPPTFDAAGYDALMQRYYPNADGQLPSTPLDEIHPKKPISLQTFDAYKAAIRHEYKRQVADGNNSQHWEQIWLMNHEELKKVVATRKTRTDKANYVEKVGAEFQPYAAVEEYSLIEDCIWETSGRNNKIRDTTSHMRHRYCLLHLTSGILRCESLYKAELSDFVGVEIPKRDNDIDPMYIMVNQISEGKTNKGRKLYGRATRHRDVSLCCVGALAFYLALRFYQSEEFHSFTFEDWCKNETWFDVKLLVDVQSNDFAVEMKNNSYSRFVSKILKNLNLTITHLCHLGRNIGAKLLQLLEGPDDETRIMGQWKPSTQDNSYSAKLPIGPIRRLAGFTSTSKQYWLPRCRLIPPDELLQQTPFAWCYEALGEFEGRGDTSHPTAVGFLRFVCQLSTIFLQDAAALLYEHPGRKDHPMFHTLPCLQSEAFKLFCVQMHENLETVSQNSPLDANLDTVMPGIRDWHRNTTGAINLLSTKQSDMAIEVSSIAGRLDSIDGRLDSFVDVLQDNQHQSRQVLHNTLKGFLANMLSAISQGSMDENQQATTSPSLHSLLVRDCDSGNAEKQLLSMESAFPVSQSLTNRECRDGALIPRATTVTTPMDTDNAETMDDPSKIHSNFVLRSKHKSLFSLWHEWHGTEDFSDNFGGVDGRDKLHRHQWRKHLDKQVYSRNRRIVVGIRKHAEIHSFKNPLDSIATELENIYTTKCNCSTQRLVD